MNPLAPGQRNEVPRPMDLAMGEPVDLEELVDRGVAGNTYDHPLSLTALSNSTASASVGWALVPPTARVESAPQAQPSDSARSTVQPLRRPVRSPASNESP